MKKNRKAGGDMDKGCIHVPPSMAMHPQPPKIKMKDEEGDGPPDGRQCHHIRIKEDDDGRAHAPFFKTAVPERYCRQFSCIHGFLNNPSSDMLYMAVREVV
eukprot:TRINITY_DN35159_c1_g1_i1.p1 TRINITY_DN35159_c1_g1~~TRINITY_DN35159_c1_g1_i1.p1  ORF type:complete len:101 (+),score=20.35 TRINITY_DN35159_c1_g1_i1:301-603(+)